MQKNSPFAHLNIFSPERKREIRKQIKPELESQTAESLKKARVEAKVPKLVDSIFDMLMKDLREHLRTAMKLELSTLPPYLTALYSIPEGTNFESIGIIRSVAMEEMYHFTLAGNILNAVGGKVEVDTKDFVPTYPGYLPDISHELVVSLLTFSPDAIALFMRIEEPEDPPKFEDISSDSGYQTIGQFYAAVENLLDFICDLFPDDWVFTGDPNLQIDSNYYYGGGGIVKPVHNRPSAKWAIRTIVDQGEGLEKGTKVCDGDHQFGQEPEPAHYYRFQEIQLKQQYKCSDKPGHPTGETFEVDYDAAPAIIKNPKSKEYAKYPEIAAKNLHFNQHYMHLLHLLTEAFNGDQEQFIKAVGVMYELKYHAQALMNMPIPGEDYHAAPTWEWVG